MSLYDYLASHEISAKSYPFYALIMAAMRQADTINLSLLQRAFPEVWADYKARYFAPGGRLENEQ